VCVASRAIDLVVKHFTSVATWLKCMGDLVFFQRQGERDSVARPRHALGRSSPSGEKAVL